MSPKPRGGGENSGEGEGGGGGGAALNLGRQFDQRVAGASGQRPQRACVVGPGAVHVRLLGGVPLFGGWGLGFGVKGLEFPAVACACVWGVTIFYGGRGA